MIAYASVDVYARGFAAEGGRRDGAEEVLAVDRALADELLIQVSL